MLTEDDGFQELAWCMSAYILTMHHQSESTQLFNMQSKEVSEVRMDLRALIAPLFCGLTQDSPVCMARLESKV